MTLAGTDISIGFDDGKVLDELSVDVSPGEVVTIVGPSGTGKTTLLRLLAVFQPPEQGTVTWNGTDVWSLSDSDRLGVRRRLSMVFQEPSLFNAPVLQNVSYGLRVRRSWNARIQEAVRNIVGRTDPPTAVETALETVGLREKATQNALSLSGGEAQRVAFARALAVDPEILLLDEPSSNLDPRNTAVLEEAIRTARDRGVGVMVATHDMNQANRISDRVGVLLDGKIIETGPPEQIFNAPTDSRTERFVDGELMYDDSADHTEPTQSTPPAGQD